MPRFSASSKAVVFYGAFVALSLHGHASATCIPEGEFDPSVDYFPAKVSEDPTDNWEVQYMNHYKVVREHYVNVTMVLTQCGAPEPDRAQFPADTRYFTIPLNTLAIDETVSATMLELLGQRQKIKYVDTTWLTSPCINAMKMTDQVQDLASQWNGGLELRQQQIDKVEALFGKYVTDVDPKHIPFGPTHEAGTVTRAKWIEYLSTFFNKEKEAKAIYDGVASRYQCHSKAALEYAEQHGKPVVAWLNYESWNELKYVIQDTPYKRKFTEDAGAIFFGETKQAFATAAELHEALLAGNVTIVVDEAYNLKDMDSVVELYELNLGTSAGLATQLFSNDNVLQWWRNDRKGKPVGDDFSNDLFEAAIPEPDVLLEDMISFIHPKLHSSHERIWFRSPYASREIMTAKCGALDEATQLKQNGCPFSGVPNDDTCDGHCFQKAPSGCWCDEACEEHNDCCADKRQFCVQQEQTCLNSCGGRGKGGCYCDGKCLNHGDCCPDFEELCSRPGSCVNHCGSKKPVPSSNPQCYCDKVCTRKGDCCEDHATVCASSPRY